MFELDSKLDQDTLPLLDLSLSKVLLFKDPELFWIILVPRSERKVCEFFELGPHDQSQLTLEISVISQIMKEQFKPTKINIGMLGNIVSQLHVHIIARLKNDRAWPGPIWGVPAKGEFKLNHWEHKIEVFKDLVSHALGRA